MDEPKTGPCPHKHGEDFDCWYQRARGPVVCNMMSMDQVRRCPRYYRMAELHDAFPWLWRTGGTCCMDLRLLLLKCAESGGYMAGAIDARIYPNDGKDVWRNYERFRLQFCPFCGAKQPDPLATSRDDRHGGGLDHTARAGDGARALPPAGPVIPGDVTDGNAVPSPLASCGDSRRRHF